MHIYYKYRFTTGLLHHFLVQIQGLAKLAFYFFSNRKISFEYAYVYSQRNLIVCFNTKMFYTFIKIIRQSCKIFFFWFLDAFENIYEEV